MGYINFRRDGDGYRITVRNVGEDLVQIFFHSLWYGDAMGAGTPMQLAGQQLLSTDLMITPR